MTGHTLVVHTGGVGDFCCTLPTLQRLAVERTLHVAGIKERAALAVAAGIADAAHDLDAIGFHRVFSEPDGALREFLSRYDEAIVWMKDEDGTLKRTLEDGGVGTVRCLPPIPTEGADRHAVLWYAHHAEVDVTMPVQLDFGPVTPSDAVVIQPGSGGRSKNWPLDNFRQLAASLEEAGHTVVWCLGPAEAGLTGLSPVLPAMPVAELARRLAGARLYVGNDSGISHLAAITGCPTVAVFGPTNAAVWRPAGPDVQVLQGNPWPSWETVQETVTEALRHP